jgi:hypothetical protein
MNSIQRRWEGLKENIFGLFYVLTEQKNQRGGGRGWSALRCSLIFLVDAGQLLKALVLAEYGWSAEVTAFVEKFDVIKLILALVRLNLVQMSALLALYVVVQIPHPYIPGGICFLIAVACVTVMLVDVALVLRIFQASSSAKRTRPSLQCP